MSVFFLSRLGVHEAHGKTVLLQGSEQSFGFPGTC